MRQRNTRIGNAGARELSTEVSGGGIVTENDCSSVASDSNGVSKVASGSGRKRVVVECTKRSVARSSVVGTPYHAANGDTSLDECTFGDDGVAGNDGSSVRTVERTEVDRVDASQQMTGFGNDGVALDERSGSLEDNDTSICSIGDSVTGDSRVLAGHTDSVRPFSRREGGETSCIGIIRPLIPFSELVPLVGRVTTGADLIVGDEHAVAIEMPSLNSVKARPSSRLIYMTVVNDLAECVSTQFK